ncbi:hypothetical protein [Sinorhizobium fredii]|uniref:hypothetical protein n=1 Tax=Rhizobium fredii TaxID=380 RepID=UPI003516BEF4
MIIHLAEPSSLTPLLRPNGKPKARLMASRFLRLRSPEREQWSLRDGVRVKVVNAINGRELAAAPDRLD